MRLGRTSNHVQPPEPGSERGRWKTTPFLPLSDPHLDFLMRANRKSNFLAIQ